MSGVTRGASDTGVLLDGSRLPSECEGRVCPYNGQAHSVMDGLFSEAKELDKGYTLIR